MSNTLPLPDWQQHEVPSMQVTDLQKQNKCLTDELQVYPAAAREADDEFLEWVNSYRVPLQHQLATGDLSADERLASRRLDLKDLRSLVFDISGMTTYRYPGERIVMLDKAQEEAVYREAIGAITPGLQFSKEDDVQSQYNPMLGVICVNDRLLVEKDVVSMADSIADSLGNAALGGIVDLSITRDPQPTYRYWFGYQYYCNGELYGGAIQKAATNKLAALTRERLGIIAPDDADHPLLEPYRRPDGYYHETGMAVVLDTINQAAFPPSSYGIYESIWAFARKGRDAAARDEAAQIVHYATNGSCRLEELEAVPVANEGMPLTLLARVEEACEIEASRRVSPLLKSRGVIASDSSSR